MYQANPAEAVVKRAKNLLKKLIEERFGSTVDGPEGRTVDWEPLLVEVQKIMNATPQKNRGYAIPYTTLTGRAPRTEWNFALKTADVDLRSLLEEHTDDENNIDLAAVQSDLLAAGLEVGTVESFISGFRTAHDDEYTEEDATEFAATAESMAAEASETSANQGRVAFNATIETRKRKAIEEGATVEMFSLVSVPVPGVRDRSSLVPGLLPAIVVQFEACSSSTPLPPFTLAASIDGPLVGRYEASQVSKGPGFCCYTDTLLFLCESADSTCQHVTWIRSNAIFQSPPLCLS